jgi:hypothetical protein
MRILGIVDVDIDKPRHKEAAAEIARRSARACLANCSLIAAGRDTPLIDQQASVGQSVERVRLLKWISRRVDAGSGIAWRHMREAAMSPFAELAAKGPAAANLLGNDAARHHLRAYLGAPVNTALA